MGRVRFSEGVHALVMVVMLLTACGGVALALMASADDDERTVTADPCPDQTMTQAIKKAMEMAKQKKMTACIEVVDPADMAGFYCVEYHTLLPRGSRAL